MQKILGEEGEKKKKKQEEVEEGFGRDLALTFCPNCGVYGESPIVRRFRYIWCPVLLVRE